MMWCNLEFKIFRLRILIALKPNRLPWAFAVAWQGKGLLIDWMAREYR